MGGVDPVLCLCRKYVSSCQWLPYRGNSDSTWVKTRRSTSSFFVSDSCGRVDSFAAEFLMLKAILRGFELASGLKINFHKNNVFGINVPSSTLEEASALLHCKIGKFPYSYLGIPIAANARSMECWSKKLYRVCLGTSRGVEGCTIGKYIRLASVEDDELI
ncbi:hypothetical protein RIF29_05137 [Crotalaria pallida]|uniref:Reverse transcriptase n=1 Tax=Crotalaria pallida TaxID=3830 RepID=A0AAN9PAS4_CROPI